MMTRLIQIVSTLLLAALLVGCERFPMNTVQHGYRGTGMVQVYNPRTLETQDALKTAPAPLPNRSDRKSTRLNSSHSGESRMPSSA